MDPLANDAGPDVADDEGGVQLNPSLRVAFTLSWSDPRTGELKTWVEQAPVASSLVEFVATLLVGGERLANLELDEKLAEVLLREGLLTDGPLQLPQPQFRPTLADATNSTEAAGDLVPNPHCHRHDEVPPELLTSFGSLAFLAPDHQCLLWVQAPHTRAWSPYFLEPTELLLVESVLRGERSPASLDATTRARLHAAYVLLQPTQAADGFWENTVSTLRAKYAEVGCVLLPELLPAAQHRAVHRYFDELETSGNMIAQLVDPKMRRRYTHREPACEFLHQQSLEIVRAVLGDDGVRRSYSFFGTYGTGAELERHRDRPQCQWNISLMLDADPVEEATSWPLHIEGRDGQDFVAALRTGDAVLYSGVELWHWRNPQPPGMNKATATFFHYVDAAFEGSLD